MDLVILLKLFVQCRCLRRWFGRRETGSPFAVTGEQKDAPEREDSRREVNLYRREAIETVRTPPQIVGIFGSQHAADRG
jgi:hypothetical protein